MNINTMKVTIQLINGLEAYIINCPYSVSDTQVKNKVYSLYEKNNIKSIYREKYGFLQLVK